MMVTYAYMGILLLTMAVVTLAGVKYAPDKDSFLSQEEARFFRGFWCIIVILVHIPLAFGNRIQDMLGSFGYIGVTFYFMTSAYGLKYSVAHKEGYMKRFWRNRLPGLLVPAALISIFITVAQVILKDTASIPTLLYNSLCWLIVLLVCYLAFWIVYRVLPAVIKKPAGSLQDIVMVIIIIAFSLIDRFTDFKITLIWRVEPLGFAYGILAATHAEKIKNWIGRKWWQKCVLLLIASVALGLMYLKFKPVEIWGDYLLKIVLGIAITMFIFQVVGKIRIGNKVNAFLGSISYEVFLIHGYVITLFAWIFAGRHDVSGVFIWSVIGVTVVLAVIVNRLSKPVIKLFKR